MQKRPCMLLTKEYMVMDEFGDPLRVFRNNKDAKEFVKNKPNCKIIKVQIDTNEFGEIPF
jgi:hypothetical protein